MNAQPLVSVLIPVFNVEKYIVESVKSICGQTYKNIEIIIVDDFSEDNTYLLCLKLAEADCRIKVFRNPVNLKIAATLNRAFSESSGQFIARMDGDDISDSERIERQLVYLNDNSEIDLVGVNLIGVDEFGKELNRFEHLTESKALIKSAKYVTPVSHVWVARRVVYERLHGYRDIPGCEDYDFLLRMLSNGMMFGNVKNYYGYYVRLHRLGNTQSSIGLRQRKLFNYVYRLYEERRRKGVDSFTAESMDREVYSYVISNAIYKFSGIMLQKAIIAKSNKNVFLGVVYIVCSLISPHQVCYLYQRLRYRIIRF